MPEPLDVNTEGLRERNVPTQAPSPDVAKKTVIELNAVEDAKSDRDDHKRTFGRTPDGVVFTVPQTRDMVSQLLSPSEPKNISDIVVLIILALHVSLLWFLPFQSARPILALLFLFWRTCYNLGIGLLLHAQSHQKILIRWATKYKVFVNPKTGKNPHPWLYKFIKRELETKIPRDYRFEEAPIEYNTWLVFRRIVDLILMCDFVSYCSFAIACGKTPIGEVSWMTTLRWSAGVLLVVFNLWVKLDAHRVVKDFAWYWGDFFYLIDQELTFDGVFEMAPHPMYSVGYAGYYGISLMAASYKVLFISIVAHAAQFAFLVWVENPHIERTYNSPPPKRRLSDVDIFTDEKSIYHAGHVNGAPPLASTKQPSPVHNLIGVTNIDLYRTTDVSVIILQVFMFALTVLTPSTNFHRDIFIANAIVWRLWYSVGIGYMLNRQSEKKKWTRHFVKFGESTEEAWRQWKGTYHLSMVLCYASLVAASYKTYRVPPVWTEDMNLLKHVLGFALITLQIWVSVSIYESLGEFGWFYGDFFFDQSPKLTYSGIYRFLNNPERILGLAGVWGAALITGSSAILFIAILSHVLSLAFIQFVERPHMQKLYGRSLRQTSGLSRSIKRSLPPPLRSWQDNVDKVLGETFDFVEDFLDAARPKLAAGVNTFITDTKDLFHKYPARISITRLEPDVAGFNPKDYSLSISADSAPPDPSLKHSTDDPKKTPSRPLTFVYGAPITLSWTAPLNHSKRDWIGLYLVGDNTSREVTTVSSQGRWIATNSGDWEMAHAERGLISSDIKNTRKDSGSSTECFTGEMRFTGDKLWWVQGVFEFRYHHNGKHNVMGISSPFAINIPPFKPACPPSQSSDSSLQIAVENALLPVVRNCLDRDPEIAPAKVDEPFGVKVEREAKYARRVVYAVKAMFGIEFAAEVVRADGCVRNLAWRVVGGWRVLELKYLSQWEGEKENEDTDPVHWMVGQNLRVGNGQREREKERKTASR
ncbi:MAG: hypothetical protein Q9227_005211 [Pyrenula ochraceoflavens]